MNNSEFFSNVDIMLTETLSTKPLNRICEEFKNEVESNRGEYKNNFDMALKMGESGERIVRMFLEKLGYIFLSKCENISHDYKFLKGGKEQVFEIKTDVAHMFVGDDGNLRDTGNIAIEYESRGKKSGIAATNAEFFVTYYPQLNEVWLIKTEKLKEIIRANKDSIKKVEGGDSKSGTKMFLLKKEKFKSDFRISKIYNNE